MFIAGLELQRKISTTKEEELQKSAGFYHEYLGMKLNKVRGENHDRMNIPAESLGRIKWDSQRFAPPGVSTLFASVALNTRNLFLVENIQS